ncbi:MAG: glycosyltransferase family 2 protein [Candidatus Eremiobacteraeota bacterium]|nr:glycosyltransferase family 2 protein [Candidatus Eremiobacteraeota bacterium]
MHASSTYVLPIRRRCVDPGEVAELRAYLWGLAVEQIIVVDGSPPAVFAEHHRAWSPYAFHVPVDADIVAKNGKVAGVLTGMRRAAYEAVVLADDDVRYDERSLGRVLGALRDADIVRPQNYFDELPWHALFDTARTLCNRALGGDWPGTLALRRSVFERAGGYSGDVLFENLELVRTIRASGGRERLALAAYVARRPPAVAHFGRQRVRQAYDEFARPLRMATALAILPAIAISLATRRGGALAVAAAGCIALAECGRRRAGGTAIFPAAASLLAPLWVLERAVCSWLAVATRLRHGGVRYGDCTLSRAATPAHVLRARFRERARCSGSLVRGQTAAH